MKWDAVPPIRPLVRQRLPASAWPAPRPAWPAWPPVPPQLSPASAPRKGSIRLQGRRRGGEVGFGGITRAIALFWRRPNSCQCLLSRGLPKRITHVRHIFLLISLPGLNTTDKGANLLHPQPTALDLFVNLAEGLRRGKGRVLLLLGLGALPADTALSRLSRQLLLADSLLLGLERLLPLDILLLEVGKEPAGKCLSACSYTHLIRLDI